MEKLEREKISLIGWALILLITLQIVFASIGALSQFQREFWHDSINHNRICLESKSFEDLRSKVSYESQPLLDYMMRSYIYLPILGDTERAIRLPDLAFYILALIASTILSYRWLRSTAVKNNTIPLTGALITLLYLSSIPTLSFYASEGRHYSWCAFISIIWVFVALKWVAYKSWVFHCVSFLYLNSHFFVWPLVGAFYIYDYVELRREKKKNELLRSLFGGLAIFAMSILLNYGAILYMINSLSIVAYTQRGIEATHCSLCYISDIWKLLLNYLETLNLIYIIIPLIICLVIGKEKKLSLALIICLFALSALAVSSDYTIRKRYFLPLTGIAYASFLYLTSCIIRQSHELYTKTKKRNILRKLILILSIVLVAFTLLKPMLRWETPSPIALINNTKFPNENFTSMWKFFEGLNASKKRAVIISLSEWETKTLRYYWDKIRDKSPEAVYFSIYEVKKDKKNLRGILKRKEMRDIDTDIYLYSWDTCDWQIPQEYGKLERVYCTDDYINRCIYKVEDTRSLFELENLIKAIIDAQSDKLMREKVELTY